MLKKSRRLHSVEFNFVPEDLIDYRSSQSLKYLCSADQILERIRYDFNIIFKNLREGIFDILNVLPNDKDCLCNLGWGPRPHVNKQFCVACELIRRICPGVRLPESRFFSIETGKHIGRVLKFREIKGAQFGTYTRNHSLELLFNQISKQENSLSLLDDSFYNFNKRTHIYTTESILTNYILTCVFISNKMNKYRMPNNVLLDWAYECGNKIELIEPKSMTFLEMSCCENLQKQIKTPMAQSKVNPLNINVIFSLLKQLVSILHFLNKYSFIHGSPSIDYIKITNKPCSYKYGDVNIESPVTLHLQPSFNTSFSYETDKGQCIRLISCIKSSHSSFTEYPIELTDVIVNHKKKPVSDNDEIPMVNELKEHLVYCYKIGDNLNTFLKYSVESGLPLLHTSFEFYCFMIGLLCEDSFYITFIENDSLRTIWYSLWRISEYETMCQELLKLKTNDKVSLEQITEFVSKFTLRSDALRFFWECLSQK